MIVGGILGNAMFLYAASIVEEEHVIYLFFILTLQFLILNREPHPEFLHLLSQPLVIVLDLLVLGLYHFPLLRHPMSFSFDRLLPPSSVARPLYRQCFEQ